MERARIKQLRNDDLRIATKLRLRIVEEVLTLKCPRCKRAFIDFDGCFAITCFNQNCKCNFCAWCLKDCGDSHTAHTHVSYCPESASKLNLQSPFRAFEDHHRKRKVKLTKSLLDKEDLSLGCKKILKEMLVKDMKELNFLWPLSFDQA